MLKAPARIFALEALFAEYPDTYVIQTHRDPVKVIASVSSLDAVLRKAFTDRMDVCGIGLEALQQWSTAMTQAMEIRESTKAWNDRFFEVYFQDLVQDPLATVQRIYTHFGFPLTKEVKSRMEQYLLQNLKDQHGVHRYSLAQFRLTNNDVIRTRGRMRLRIGLLTLAGLLFTLTLIWVQGVNEVASALLTAAWGLAAIIVLQSLSIFVVG